MGKVSKLATTDLFKNFNSNKFKTLNDDEIKKLQKKILSIADDIIGICEDNNIVYNLGGGSCLGSVRHNGFIPWDDDLDINVARKDYEKLLKLISEKYKEKYFIHNCYSDNEHCIPATQIRLKNTIVKGINDYSNTECGAYIDISIIENTYDNKVLRTIHGFLSLTLGFIVSCRKFAYAKKFFLELSQDNKEANKIFKQKIIIGKLFSFLTLRRWTIIYDKINKMCKNENSKYVTVPTGRKHFFGEIYKREDFYKTTYHNFEGRMWKIPKNYNGYLIHMYGNYMEIPKKENIEKHILLDFNL